MPRSRFWLVIPTCVAVFASACGTQQDVERASVDGRTPAERLNYLNTQIVGDRMSWTIRGWRAHHQLQDAVTSCMADAGFEYAAPPFMPSQDPALPVSPVDWSDALAPPDMLSTAVPSRDVIWAVEHSAVREHGSSEGEPANPGFTSLGAADQAVYNASLDGCLAAANELALEDDVSQPSVESQEVQGLLKASVVEAVAEDEAVQSGLSGYEACLAAKGIQAEDFSSLRAQLVGKANEALSATGPQTLSTDSPAWARYLSVEQRSARADASCRKEAHEAAMEVVDPVVISFAQDHADEIARAAEEWQRLNSEYEADMLGELGLTR